MGVKGKGGVHLTSHNPDQWPLPGTKHALLLVVSSIIIGIGIISIIIVIITITITIISIMITVIIIFKNQCWCRPSSYAVPADHAGLQCLGVNGLFAILFQAPHTSP